MGQRPLMWSAACSAPQSQQSLVVSPQRSMVAPKLPTSVRILFSRVQARRDRPTPCPLFDGVGMYLWSLVVVDAHDSPHLVCVQCFTISCGGTEDTSWWAWWVSGRRDLSLFRWVEFSMASCSRWSCWHARRPNTRVAASRLRTGGAISASTGSWSTWVGRKHPVMVRREALRPTSTKRVWLLLHHTGAHYSAGEYTSARVEVLNDGVLAPSLCQQGGESMQFVP